MTTFAFWNTNRKQLSPLVSELAHENRVNLLALAECPTSPTEMLESLNVRGAEFEYLPPVGCEKIQFYATFQASFLSIIYEREWLSIRHLELPGLVSILVVAAHFPSKHHWDERSQDSECVEFSRLIREAESTVGHQRTLLFGDLNMHPFQAGMVSANGLHGVMTQKKAAEGSRRVNGVDYPMFYNPMWNFLGDETRGPPGTYYSVTPGHRTYFWNMLDQVLIRPDLLSRFSINDLRIVESIGQTRLLTSAGLPNRTRFSDHLPLVIQLQL